MTTRYFQGISQETKICKVFQTYINKKRSCSSYLRLRKNKQAPIDFLGRLYDIDTNKTIAELAVEVRSLKISKKQIEASTGYIEFPISKLNELMVFWRMGKEVYIVYSLQGDIYFLSWDYYVKHNFEVMQNIKGISIKLPTGNLILCGII